MSTFKTTFALSAAVFTAAAMLSPVYAGDKAAAPAPGQAKVAGEAANPAGKQTAPGQTGANQGQTVAADCAKLADPKAKDDCVKKAQAAAAHGTGNASGAANGAGAGDAAGKTKPY